MSSGWLQVDKKSTGGPWVTKKVSCLCVPHITININQRFLSLITANNKDIHLFLLFHKITDIENKMCV